MKKLNDTYEIMLLGSVRYFIGRTSIVATTFPENIVVDLLPNMDQNQKELLRREIEYGLEPIKDHSDMKLMDKWVTLMDYLTETNRYLIIEKENEQIDCFMSFNKFIPIDRYLANPYPLTYIDPNAIWDVIPPPPSKT